MSPTPVPSSAVPYATADLAADRIPATSPPQPYSAPLADPRHRGPSFPTAESSLINPLPFPISTRRVSLPDGADLTVYLDGPANAPVTLVLVHGLSVTADLWRLHTPPLAAQGIRVVRYDQRAHGQSTRGTAPITLEGLADDLSVLIDSLAAHGPLVLAGHSMGGMILQTLTTMRPDLLPRIQGLLLISTPDGPVTTRPVPGLRTRVLSWGRGLLAHTCTHAPAVVNAIRRRLPRASPWALSTAAPGGDGRSVPVACRRGLHHTATRDIAAFWQALAIRGSRPVDGLRTLGPRLTLLAGSADVHVPAGHTQALARRLPQTRFVLTDQATHTLPIRYPHAVVESLTKLLSTARKH